MLAIIYTLLLGLLCACFVEVGIKTFLPGPVLDWEGVEGGEPDSPEMREKRERVQVRHQAKVEKSSMVHYVVSLAGSTVLASISLSFSVSLGVLANGILLGAVFLLGSGTVFGITGGGRLARFAVSTVSLIVTLALGWFVFLPHKPM